MGKPENALQVTQTEWSEEDKKLIWDTVAKGTSASEFKLFLYTANRYQLDPLVKQVWCVKYGNGPASIFTGRDGFLSIAHRSDKFDGMETVAIKDNGKLVGARCTVWRKDMAHPFVVEVALSEYNTGKGNWQRMPETMIKKVAESQALRRAFDVSGIYAPEEIDQEYDDDKQRVVEAEPRPVSNQSYRKEEEIIEVEGKTVEEKDKAVDEPPLKRPSVAQLRRMFTMAKEANCSADALKNLVQNFYGKTSSKDLTLDEYENICSILEENIKESKGQSKDAVPF